MSERRHGRMPAYRWGERGPTGRPICRGCGGECPPGRRSWCGDACVEDALIRAGDAGAVARALFRRDRGVCAICGADAAKVERIIACLQRDTHDFAAWEINCEAVRVIREAWGRRRYSGIYRLWEADHTVPVCEGGGECGLDGYRTLCRPCHRPETAKLAVRLGLRRRRQRPLPFEGKP